MVVGAAPLEGDAFAGDFALFFSKPLEAASATEALTIEPPLAGTTTVSGNVLRFRARDFDLRQVYRVTLGDGLRGEDGAAPGDGPRVWQVTGTPLRVAGLRIRKEAAATVDFELRLTRSVTREALAEHLSVSGSEGALPVEGLASGRPQGQAADSWTFSVPRKDDTSLEITVDGGLRDASDRLALGVADTRIWPSSALDAPTGKWMRDGYEDALEVQFAASIDAEDLRQHLSVRDGDATLAFRIPRSGSRETHRIVVEDLPAGVEGLTIEVSDKLPTPDLRRLAETATLRLQPAAPPLQLHHRYWADAGIGEAVLRMEFNQLLDLPSLREHLSFEPDVADFTVSADGYQSYAVRGDFLPETAYNLRLSQGVKNAVGIEALEQDLVLALGETPAAQTVELGHPGHVYFPRRSAGPLEVRAQNVEEVEVTLFRLFPNNVVQAMGLVENGQTSWEFNQRLSREVAQETLHFPAERNTVHTGAVDMAAMTGDLKGVFSLHTNYSRGWLSSKIVVWTDIGLLAHWQEGELVLAAHDLLTLEALPGVQVTVYSDKNQRIAVGITDDRGVARFQGMDRSHGQPAVAVAERDDDYTFLELQPRYDDPTGFTHDMPGFRKEGYDAFLYADRNLYRPGETAHVRWIVRDMGGAAAAGVPLQFRIFNPQGTEVLTETVVLGDFGTGGLDWESAREYLTGEYRLELGVPGEYESVGSLTLHLEDFVPNRIETEVALEETVWRLGQEQAFTVAARHLFGAPAADRKAEARVILRKGDFTPPGWEDYRFTNDTEFRASVDELGTATTDAEGRAVFHYTPATDTRLDFPARVTVRGDVFELGGRAVTGAREAVLLPDGPLLGLQAGLGSDRRSLDIACAAVKADGTPSAVESVTVTLEREVWSYNVRRYEGYNETSWTKSFSTVDTRTVALSGGRGSLSLPVEEYGYFRLRLHSEATPAASTVSFYRYWDRIDIVDEARPSLIQVHADQALYALGDTVTLRIESPFDGKAFVVLQGARIHRVLTTEIEEGIGHVQFEADRHAMPNIWAGVTVAHTPVAGVAQAHPYSSFAMANVRVYDPAKGLAVTLDDLPESARPGDTVAVGVTVADHLSHGQAAEITLAAVDDGIHAILAYENPDPLAWFFRPRQADHRRAHYYDKAAYDFSPVQIGGDGIARRLGTGDAAIDENWIRPVALWSGVVETDDSGHAVVPVELPEFNGRLRLVVVAANESSVGAASGALEVRRPVMLRTSLPRFAAPGDTFEARAVVFNTTDEAASVTVEWTAEGAISGAGEQRVEVPAKGDVHFVAAFAAGDEIGGGAIAWKLDARNADDEPVEQYEETMALPVRPPAVYGTSHETASVSPGESAQFSPESYRDDEKLRSNVTVSAHPGTRLRPLLEETVRYPYGCLEQTVSRAFPLYLLRHVTAAVEGVAPASEALAHQVQGAIDRIFSMQTASGGLSFWPGSTTPYDYGSIYALHFLRTVQDDSRFRIPGEALDRLNAYVRRIAQDELDDSHDGRYRQAYAVYVLALDGDDEALDLVHRFDGIAVPAAARQLLAATVAGLTGNGAAALRHLETMPATEYNARHQGGSLNSTVRNAAVQLLTQLQIGESGPDAKLVDLLLRAAETERLTTHESAFVLAALAKYFDTLALAPEQASATVSVSRDGETLETFTISGAEVFSESFGGFVSISVESTGASPVYVAYGAEGVPLAAPTDAVAEGIRIDRAYLTETGAPHESEDFVHGDAYITVITLRLDTAAENVVVTDRLAAGFDILNPRLDTDTLAAANLEDGATPSHFEVRDDLFLAAFDRLESGTHVLYYAVRAATAGDFQAPPARAECMYDLSVHGNTVPGRARIESAGH